MPEQGELNQQCTVSAATNCSRPGGNSYSKPFREDWTKALWRVLPALECSKGLGPLSRLLGDGPNVTSAPHPLVFPSLSRGALRFMWKMLLLCLQDRTWCWHFQKWSMVKIAHLPEYDNLYWPVENKCFNLCKSYGLLYSVLFQLPFLSIQTSKN